MLEGQEENCHKLSIRWDVGYVLLPDSCFKLWTWSYVIDFLQNYTLLHDTCSRDISILLDADYKCCGACIGACPTIDTPDSNAIIIINALSSNTIEFSLGTSKKKIDWLRVQRLREGQSSSDSIHARRAGSIIHKKKCIMNGPWELGKKKLMLERNGWHAKRCFTSHGSHGTSRY